MGEDGEQDGPTGREHYRVVAGQFFVEDEDRENDCGQSARAEPADEKRIRGARSRANQAQKVTVRRSDRLLVGRTGDDGSTKLFYDGKTVVLFGIEGKKYVTIPAPNTLQGMLETVMGKLGVDFPLADFLTKTPDKSFLLGVTSGREVNTVTIDGVACRHLLFTQPPGIELELWVEKTGRSLPRRLIVTYRSERSQPSFVAELFDWNFSIDPSDAEFVFAPPEGAGSGRTEGGQNGPASQGKGYQ